MSDRYEIILTRNPTFGGDINFPEPPSSGGGDGGITRHPDGCSVLNLVTLVSPDDLPTSGVAGHRAYALLWPAMKRPGRCQSTPVSDWYKLLPT